VLELTADDIILPGLINLHTHAAMVLFRGVGNDLDLNDWWVVGGVGVVLLSLLS